MRGIERSDVVEGRDLLPSFPRVIDDVLRTLDDPEANVALLVGHVSRDPALTARVLAEANAMAIAKRKGGAVRDLYTATAMLGLARLRQLTLTATMTDFVRGIEVPDMFARFWKHSVATSVAAQLLALRVEQPVDTAIIGGLLHDIGRLWLYRFMPQAYAALWSDFLAGKQLLVALEQERLGVDHALIGGWLAESWNLPKSICDAIRHHHAPEAMHSDMLVALIHLSEVISNALDLAQGDGERVGQVSRASCALLKLHWDEADENLLGRIDASAAFVIHSLSK